MVQGVPLSRGLGGTSWSAAQQRVKRVLGDEILIQLNRAVKRIGAAASG